MLRVVNFDTLCTSQYGDIRPIDTFFYESVTQSAAVNAGIATDLHVILDNYLADVGKAQIFAVLVLVLPGRPHRNGQHEDGQTGGQG